MTEAPHEAGRALSERSTPARLDLGARSRLPAAALILALAAAALLIAAEASPLYHLHVADHRSPVGSGSTGAHNAYGLVPLATLAAGLALAARRGAGRAASAAITALGLVALGIALLGDLPAARAQGVLRLAGHLALAHAGPAGHLVLAHAAPAAGFYLETLGAILMLISGGWGLLLAAADW